MLISCSKVSFKVNTNICEYLHGIVMDRDRRLTGYLRGQSDRPRAPDGFELNNAWKVRSPQSVKDACSQSLAGTRCAVTESIIRRILSRHEDLRRLFFSIAFWKVKSEFTHISDSIYHPVRLQANR